MAAAATDLFQEVGLPGSATTLSAPGYTIGDTSVNVGSTTNHPTATGYTFAIDVVTIIDGEQVRTDGTYCEFVGTVSNGTTITNVSKVFGDAQNYAAGALTRVYVPVSSERENRLVEGITQQHTQAGAHKSITTDTIVTSGNVTIGGSLTIGGVGSGGYDPITGTVTAVTANGNRSYSLTTSADNTALISPGMRLRTTRTVAAPTQCTSLNGTTQYYSKTSPAGMTFTDDFAVSAWVKLTSYAAGTLISRFNGTSGWRLLVAADGTFRLQGFNAGAGNYRFVGSYQSIPLNKWVHITAFLDMSGNTYTSDAGATNNYLMIDGVVIPGSMSQAGTNPTALIQAGDLEIGADTGASTFFPGKIAQAAVFSARVTPTTMRTYMSQGLAGTETSLISAYSFNNTINDLNANANNLTAQGSAVATNADSPFGNGGVSSTLDYALVMAISASTITVQVPEGCTIPTTGGITAVSYATSGTPFGWVNKSRFTVSSVYKAQTGTSVNNTTAQLTGGALTLPIGDWDIGIRGNFLNTNAGVTNLGAIIGLSTLTNSLTDDLQFTRGNTASIASSSAETDGYINTSSEYSVAAQTPIYMDSKTTQNNTVYYAGGSVTPTRIFAIPAGL